MTTTLKNQPKTALFMLQQAIRNFFLEDDFLDVLVPLAVENPGMETHIHPFQIYSSRDQCLKPLFLHTSPEFQMKGLLSEGLEKIFTINYCFRDEPDSETHRPQFLMLEWYRANERYEKIMNDCEELFNFCQNFLHAKNFIEVKKEIIFTKMTVQEIFLEIINIDILEYSKTEDLYKLIETRFTNIHLSENLSWDDLFFLLMLNEVEPHFEKYDFLLLYEFPAPLKALSTIKKSDPRVCERFEVYAKGIEICNCFNELTDFAKQKKRFLEQAIEKKNIYGYELPTPEKFYDSLHKGLPKSAGIALGVERLLMVLTGIKTPFF